MNQQHTFALPFGTHRTKWTGSGCIIIDHGDVILVREKRSGTYNDCGGDVDNHNQSLAYNSAKEMQEETYSACTIGGEFLAASCIKVDIPDGKNDGTSRETFYRCFIVKTNDFSCRKYYANMRNSSYNPKGISGYGETDGCSRFPISELYRDFQNNGGILPRNLHAKTPNSTTRHITHGRVRRILNICLANNII
jgi:hypothetical protein